MAEEPQADNGKPKESGSGATGSLPPQVAAKIAQIEKLVRDRVKAAQAKSQGAGAKAASDGDGDAPRATKTGPRFRLPEDAGRHLSASKREFLLFLRTMIDAELTRTEPAPKESEKSSS